MDQTDYHRGRQTMNRYTLRKVSWFDAATVPLEPRAVSPLVKDYLKALAKTGRIGKAQRYSVVPPEAYKDDSAFLVKTKNLWYYVDTEGADYPRYMVALSPELSTELGFESVPFVSPSDRGIEIGVNDSISRSRRLLKKVLEKLSPVDYIISYVERHLGDVVTNPEDEEDVRENAWVLAHDAATELGGSADATELATLALQQLGFS